MSMNIWRAIDNDMDLGTLQNNVHSTLDNVYEEGPESDSLRTLSNGEEASLLTAADTVKRSQPLLIQSHRKPKEEEEPRALSLPSIPNPFPELCSPSNSPILSNSSLGSGSQREGGSHVGDGNRHLQFENKDDRKTVLFLQFRFRSDSMMKQGYWEENAPHPAKMFRSHRSAEGTLTVSYPHPRLQTKVTPSQEEVGPQLRSGGQQGWQTLTKQRQRLLMAGSAV
uniref:Uncharacterized protein n=1 Tax=Sphaerodactylus townsendi TaxID=933632 RepID=A0ACB8EU60_9SAUR